MDTRTTDMNLCANALEPISSIIRPGLNWLRATTDIKVIKGWSAPTVVTIETDPKAMAYMEHITPKEWNVSSERSAPIAVVRFLKKFKVSLRTLLSASKGATIMELPIVDHAKRFHSFIEAKQYLRAR